MDNMIKNALKYTIGIVAFLTILALYFFFMMSKNLMHQEEPKSVVKTKTEATVPQQCDVESNDAELTTLQQDLDLTQGDLERARNEYDSCTASLTQSERDITSLQTQIDSLKSSQSDGQGELVAQLDSELLDAKNKISTLQEQIDALEDEKQDLISASSGDASVDEQIANIQSELSDKNAENRELSATISALESQLAENESVLSENQQLQQAEAELQTQLASLNNERSELLARIEELESADEVDIASGELTIVKFETLPVFCDRHRSANAICVSSFEMATTFNFRPNGFVSLRLVDPEGDTIQRESIAAQEVNLYSFDIGDEILDAGEYSIEIKIDDVFNQFDSTQTFTLSLPADILNQLNSGQ